MIGEQVLNKEPVAVDSCFTEDVVAKRQVGQRTVNVVLSWFVGCEKYVCFKTLAEFGDHVEPHAARQSFQNGILHVAAEHRALAGKHLRVNVGR